MTLTSSLAAGFAKALSLKGLPIRIQYFSLSGTGAGSVYDDAGTLVQSGTSIWLSGAVFPLKTTEGSEDSVLLEQGKLQNKDKKLYVNGSTVFADLNKTVKIQLGSPTGDIYSTIPLGAKLQSIGTDDIYKKQYIRYLPTGSF